MQIYRHVDYIEIENQEIMDRFLDYWRKTGHQRAGYLIGRYEPFPDVPLGIKATVCAIYEPPQLCGENFINLEEDPNEEQVDALCASLGLKRVGWIFTDLTHEENGKVKYKRSAVSVLWIIGLWDRL